MKNIIPGLSNALSGKSKTINANVALTTLVIGFCRTCCTELTPEDAITLLAVGYGLMNIILRFVTKQPLDQKGESK